MLKLYFAPRTRAIRVRWLLEELGLPHELARVPFIVPSHTFAQSTSLGKLPVLEDGDVTICESGAIVEDVVERYGGGRLAPPIGVVVWHTLYEGNADRSPEVIASARGRALEALGFVSRRLEGRDYLLGAEFSAADIMMGFTLFAARALGVLDDRHPNLTRYLARLEARPAFRTAAEL
jgi:glutathione S-transferase